jgi:hypothetical protein
VSREASLILKFFAPSVLAALGHCVVSEVRAASKLEGSPVVAAAPAWTGQSAATCWLAAAQNRDGGWGRDRGAPSDVESTALAILALHALGQGDEAGMHQDFVRAGLVWLAAQQRTEGRVGDAPGEHVVAAAAFFAAAERARWQRWHDHADRARLWTAGQLAGGAGRRWDLRTLVWAGTVSAWAARMGRAPADTSVATPLSILRSRSSYPTSLRLVARRRAAFAHLLRLTGADDEMRAHHHVFRDVAAGDPELLQRHPEVLWQTANAAWEAYADERAELRARLQAPLQAMQDLDPVSPHCGSWIGLGSGDGGSRVRTTAYVVMALEMAYRAPGQRGVSRPGRCGRGRW